MISSDHKVKRLGQNPYARKNKPKELPVGYKESYYKVRFTKDRKPYRVKHVLDGPSECSCGAEYKYHRFWSGDEWLCVTCARKLKII